MTTSGDRTIDEAPTVSTGGIAPPPGLDPMLAELIEAMALAQVRREDRRAQPLANGRSKADHDEESST